MNTFLRSIPVKISLIILVIESILLAVMGAYYINRFSGEIDRSIRGKMRLPAALMSERALNFTAVMDFKVLGDLISEEVNDAFICRKDGNIFYSHDSGKSDNNFNIFLDQNEVLSIAASIPEEQLVYFTGSDGSEYISSLSPIWSYDNHVGYLYLKINADKIAARKTSMLLLFLFGSLITIILTTLFETLFVHRMLSPRINDTCEVLKKVGNGDLTACVSSLHASDELDTIRNYLTRMIGTVEQSTLELKLLNEAGASFVTVNNREELIGITSDTIVQMLELIPEPACIISSAEMMIVNPCPCLAHLDKQNLARINREEIVIVNCDNSGISNTDTTPSDRLYLSMREDGNSLVILCFYAIKGEIHLSTSDEECLRTLLRMAANALRRLKSWQKTSEAEERYRTLFNSAVEGIFRCNSDNQLEVANPALAEMTGYGTVERMLDEFNLNKGALLGDAAEQTRLRNRIMAQGKLIEEEIRPQRLDGSRFRASLTAYATCDANGELIAIEGRILNIEERKRREDAEREQQTAEAANKAKSEMLVTVENKNQQLEQALADLKQAQSRMMQSERMAAIGMTASGVAHDLNNILSGIITYPELILQRLPEDSKLRKPVKSIINAGKRAADVVDDLLTLTRGTAHAKIPIKLNMLIRDYLESVELKYLRASHPDVQVKAELDPALLPILCAPVYIHKMIMNLITNSVEAMEESGEVIVLTKNTNFATNADAPQQLEAGDYVTLKIMDNGPGISDNEVHRIFEPFYTRKTLGRSGTGLGLTIVQNAVIEHNGAITVDSGKQGTTFTIHLPADGAIKVDAGKTGNSTPQRGNGSVLVVDDDADQRKIATLILEEYGYTVNQSDSGKEAIAFCRENKVDILLLDMLMPPGINGRQTYEAIKAIHPEQKALIVSGFSENHEVDLAIEAGCYGFLKKPYTMQQLTEMAHKALNA